MSGFAKHFKRKKRLERESVIRKGDKIVGFVAYCEKCKGPTTQRRISRTKRECMRCERMEQIELRRKLAGATIVNERNGVSAALHEIEQTSERQGTAVLEKDMGMAGAFEVGDTVTVVEEESAPSADAQDSNP